MPVLMIALVALAVFGAISVLLSTAVFLEHRMHRKQEEMAGLHGSAMLAKH